VTNADGPVDNINYSIIRAFSILDSDGQIIKGKEAKTPEEQIVKKNGTLSLLIKRLSKHWPKIMLSCPQRTTHLTTN